MRGCGDCGNLNDKLYFVDKRYSLKVCSECLSKRYIKLRKAHMQHKWASKKSKEEASRIWFTYEQLIVFMNNLAEALEEMEEGQLVRVRIDAQRRMAYVAVDEE